MALAGKAFHGDPKLMTFDPASGDHGLAFYGNSSRRETVMLLHLPLTLVGIPKWMKRERQQNNILVDG